MTGLVKRSLTIAGHPTSLRLEPAFWKALADAARDDGVAMSALVARIDAARVEVGAAANLASAIRVWLLLRLSSRDRGP